MLWIRLLQAVQLCLQRGMLQRGVTAAWLLWVHVVRCKRTAMITRLVTIHGHSMVFLNTREVMMHANHPGVQQRSCHDQVCQKYGLAQAWSRLVPQPTPNRTRLENPNDPTAEPCRTLLASDAICAVVTAARIRTSMRAAAAAQTIRVLPKLPKLQSSPAASRWPLGCGPCSGGGLRGPARHPGHPPQMRWTAPAQSVK